jgi:hypothetical protein
VYLVRDGGSALIIDFGSGKILDYLQGLGITRVDGILHTHHHRDQCRGDYRAVERGIPIAGKVPGYPDLKGLMRYAGSDRRSPYNGDYNNVQPRFGIAHALGKKMSVCAGYGIYYSVSRASIRGEVGSAFRSGSSIPLLPRKLRSFTPSAAKSTCRLRTRGRFSFSFASFPGPCPRRLFH